MREIKFRGKRINNGQWVHGAYMQPTRHWTDHGKHRDWILCSAIQNGGIFNVMGRYAVVNNTVGQYTGIKDNHGVEIYEGDIVRVWDDAGDYFLEKRYVNGVVKFDDLDCYYYMIDYSDTIRYGCDDFLSNHERDIEVIGNIWDNPELLEAKQ